MNRKEAKQNSDDHGSDSDDSEEPTCKKSKAASKNGTNSPTTAVMNGAVKVKTEQPEVMNGGQKTPSPNGSLQKHYSNLNLSTGILPFQNAVAAAFLAQQTQQFMPNAIQQRNMVNGNIAPSGMFPPGALCSPAGFFMPQSAVQQSNSPPQNPYQLAARSENSMSPAQNPYAKVSGFVNGGSPHAQSNNTSPQPLINSTQDGSQISPGVLHKRSMTGGTVMNLTGVDASSLIDSSNFIYQGNFLLLFLLVVLVVVVHCSQCRVRCCDVLGGNGENVVQLTNCTSALNGVVSWSIYPCGVQLCKLVAPCVLRINVSFFSYKTCSLSSYLLHLKFNGNVRVVAFSTW